MADNYSLIDGKVVPYIGGRRVSDTDSWRDATQLELEQQEEIVTLTNRITKLENGLDALIDVAAECDSWESFPSTALDNACNVLSDT